MTSEIRVNKLTNRVGLGTVEYTNTGIVVSGISTSDNFKTGTSNLHSTGLNIFDLDVDGHTNLDNVSVAGVTTTTDHIYIDADNKKLNIGDSSDLQLYHTGSRSEIINNTGDLIIQPGASSNLFLRSQTGAAHFKGVHAAQVELYWNGNKRLETSSVGVSITKDLDVDGHTNLDNVSIAGIVTASNATISGNQILGHGNSTGNQIKFTRSGLGDELVIGTDGYGNSTQYEATIQSSIVTARPLVFATNNAERLRILGNGNVLIGTTSGTEKLCIKRNDAVGPTITLENNANKTYINNWGATGQGSGRTNRFEINATLASQASFLSLIHI